MDPAVQDNRYFKEWEALYGTINLLLARFGTENAFGRGDYWTVDESNGYKQHKVYFSNLDMLNQSIVQGLQKLLAEFPDWEIFATIDVIEMGEKWPSMGLIIRKHEIIDGLQRQYFPPEYQGIEYEGSRRGTERD